MTAVVQPPPPPPPPAIRVDKTVSPGSRVVPGGDFTFFVVVTNTGPVPLVITSLVDDIYGNLATRPEPNTCDDLIGDTLQPGQSTAPCSFTVTFTGVAGATQRDVVTVIGTDSLGRTVTDDDDAVITLTPRPQGPLSIHLDKSATPGSRLEPGGTFIFTVVVTNTSDVPLTIVSLTDDIYGNLATRGGQNTCDDLIGDVLAPGASVSCAFAGEFFGQGGDRQTDVVTVTGRDSEGRTVQDDDDATVAILDALPRIQVIKTAVPIERPVPGGAFAFRVEVRNPGVEPILLTHLVDDIYGDLNGRGTCRTGGTIQPGGSYVCEFEVQFTGNSARSQTDVVTATARDDEGNQVQDSDDATIRITPVAVSPTPPPPPPGAAPPPPPPPPPVAPKPSVLTRTGADFLQWFAFALALISGGLVMRASRMPATHGRVRQRDPRNGSR